MQSTTHNPESQINSNLQEAIDGVLDVMATANVLGAALSFWGEQFGDLTGSQELAYGIKERMLQVEECLSQVKGHLNRRL